jgi:type II secretory ATPase GspE/PulE/Tfp pilus assembly ATPase PilB-like protein
MKMCRRGRRPGGSQRHELGNALRRVWPRWSGSPRAVGAIPAKLVNHYQVFPVALRRRRPGRRHLQPVRHARASTTCAWRCIRDVEPALAARPRTSPPPSSTTTASAPTPSRRWSAKAKKDREEPKTTTPSASITKADNHRDRRGDSEANDATIVRFVNQFTAEAIRERATDIHVEPFEESLRDPLPHRRPSLRGADSARPSSGTNPAIISRIKIMAHLDIAERRLPQDGKIKIKMNKAGLRPARFHGPHALRRERSRFVS